MKEGPRRVINIGPWTIRVRLDAPRCDDSVYGDNSILVTVTRDGGDPTAVKQQFEVSREDTCYPFTGWAAWFTPLTTPKESRSCPRNPRPGLK